MNSKLSNAATELILQGDKIGAIAAIRRELNCSLADAKRIVDAFDQDLGALREETNDTSPVVEVSYRTPWFFHLFSLITSRNAWGIPKALRLARKYRIHVDYYILATHARAGGNPGRVMNEMCRAIRAGQQPDLMQLLAADLHSMQTWNE